MKNPSFSIRGIEWEIRDFARLRVPGLKLRDRDLSLWIIYQIRDRDFTSEKSEPKTLSAKDFVVMVLIKFLAVACEAHS